jgi:hypothetical protein
LNYYDVKDEIDYLVSQNKGHIFIKDVQDLNELKKQSPIFDFLSPLALPVFVQFFQTIGELKIIQAESVLFEKDILFKKLSELKKADPEIKEFMEGIYSLTAALSKQINKEFYIVGKKINLLLKGDSK